MRESDENEDRRAESTSAVTSDDVGLARTERDADHAIEDLFESGAMAPSVVMASVDALFERFEEDSPEEVMLADRCPAESDVVPATPAFDESPARGRGGESVPAPEGVDAESLTADTESMDGDADATSFEWVSEPVVTETVLADSEAAQAFAGGESDDEAESAGVLSELRSSFPF